MPRLIITSSELIVELNLAERLATWCGTIRVPLAHVRGATEDNGIRNDLGMKTVGLAIPGLIHLGRFRKQGDKQFVSARPRQHLVVVELEHETWARLIIGVADARAAAQAINAAIAQAA